jgi:hypothetical protein
MFIKLTERTRGGSQQPIVIGLSHVRTITEDDQGGCIIDLLGPLDPNDTRGPAFGNIVTTVENLDQICGMLAVRTCE